MVYRVLTDQSSYAHQIQLLSPHPGRTQHTRTKRKAKSSSPSASPKTELGLRLHSTQTLTESQLLESQHLWRVLLWTDLRRKNFGAKTAGGGSNYSLAVRFPALRSTKNQMKQNLKYMSATAPAQSISFYTKISVPRDNPRVSCMWTVVSLPPPPPPPNPPSSWASNRAGQLTPLYSAWHILPGKNRGKTKNCTWSKRRNTHFITKK